MVFHFRVIWRLNALSREPGVRVSWQDATASPSSLRWPFYPITQHYAGHPWTFKLPSPPQHRACPGSVGAGARIRRDGKGRMEEGNNGRAYFCCIRGWSHVIDDGCRRSQITWSILLFSPYSNFTMTNLISFLSVLPIHFALLFAVNCHIAMLSLPFLSIHHPPIHPSVYPYVYNSIQPTIHSSVRPCYRRFG